MTEKKKVTEAPPVPVRTEGALDKRVTRLEAILRRVTRSCEKHFGADLDGDNRIGSAKLSLLAMLAGTLVLGVGIMTAADLVNWTAGNPATSGTAKIASSSTEATLTVDIISAGSITEDTSGAGVTIDGVQIKDGEVYLDTGALDGIRTAPQPSSVITYFDDFLSIYTNDGASPVYALTQDAIGGTVTAASVLDIETGVTDNNEYTLQYGPKGTEGPFDIDTATSQKLWFEAKVTTAGKYQNGFFVGLAEPGQGADFLGDNTLTNKAVDFVGFIIDGANTSYWDIVYQKAGTGVTNIPSVLTNTLNSATTLSFAFDGASGVVFYANGTSVYTITNTAVNNFPDGEALAPIVASKTGSGIEATNTVDYIFTQQER